MASNKTTMLQVPSSALSSCAYTDYQDGPIADLVEDDLLNSLSPEQRVAGDGQIKSRLKIKSRRKMSSRRGAKKSFRKMIRTKNVRSKVPMKKNRNLMMFTVQQFVKIMEYEALETNPHLMFESR